jgi:hypothetical protein
LRAGGVAQVLELLPSKCEALSSNPQNKNFLKKGEFEEERSIVSHGSRAEISLS